LELIESDPDVDLRLVLTFLNSDRCARYLLIHHSATLRDMGHKMSRNVHGTQKHSPSAFVSHAYETAALLWANQL